MSPQDRFKRFGYWDVHSTRTQTRICLSCHLGNVEQQKIITHEFYAAGHPPLPSFELSQFVQQMPRHWRRLDEKPKRLQEDYLERSKQRIGQDSNEAHPVPQEYAVTKATLLSALVTLEESMRLTSDSIRSPRTTKSWPELANYSCFACHHELVRDGWRKRPRLLITTAGRPPLNEWPFALSPVAASLLAEDTDNRRLEDGIQNLTAALNSQPFGEFQTLDRAAFELAEILESLSRKVETLQISKEQVVRLLDQIASRGAEQNADYDSARQFVWAYESALRDLRKASGSTDAPRDVSNARSSTSAETENEVFKRFESELIVRLNSHRGSGAGEYKPEEVKLGKADQPFVHSLSVFKAASALDKISKYRPDAIQPIFKQLKDTKQTTQ